MTLYEELVAAGLKIDNHCSDLYVEDTPEAREIIKKYPAYDKTKQCFVSDKTAWLDIPFAYVPYWLGKGLYETPDHTSSSS